MFSAMFALNISDLALLHYPGVSDEKSTKEVCSYGYCEPKR